jgi:hypothetical protein
MSDHIGHLGICDDTFRLANIHSGIHPVFKEAMIQHRDVAHMGSVTRSADRWSAEIIVHARDNAGDSLALKKLVFVLGSLTHRAADRLTKPITNCWRGQPDSGGEGDAANESKIMQDIFVFKEVYGEGTGLLAAPFTPAALALAGNEAEAKAEEYFRVMLRRALISMHTIAPDPDNIQSWLTSFLERLQGYPKSLRQYARLAAEWDSEKVNRYLIQKNFYCRQDELILCARDVQRGSTVSDGRLRRALQMTGQQQSRYARALAKAIEYLLAAGELYSGQIAVEEAKRRFDVGVPELSIQE